MLPSSMQFGRCGDLVAFVETAPTEEDDGTGVFEFAAGGDTAEGERRPAVAGDLEIGRLDKIEVVAIPQIGFDDPPAADQVRSSPGRS